MTSFYAQSSIHFERNYRISQSSLSLLQVVYQGNYFLASYLSLLCTARVFLCLNSWRVDSVSIVLDTCDRSSDENTVRICNVY
jgi:hypothetical protein